MPEANVIGPFTGEDWLTLLLLKQSIACGENRGDAEVFKATRRKEKKLYEHILSPYLQEAVA